MTISLISAHDAQTKILQGAILIDMRQSDEYRREHIENAISYPLSQLQSVGLPPVVSRNSCVIFHCKSGMRTAGARELIAQLTQNQHGEVFILENGLEGWKKAGLKAKTDRSQPIELMRQVQIAAGMLVLIGVILGWFITPTFYLLAGFVGAGLTFAGITGFCGMAKLLAIMPWNKR